LGLLPGALTPRLQAQAARLAALTARVAA